MQLTLLAFRRFTLSSNAGRMSWMVTQHNNLPKAWALLLRKFYPSADTLLKTQGTGLCHEMAKYSLPTRANTQLTANNAVQKYAQENAALANVAFKPWESRSPEFWFMSGYINVTQHVMQKGFKFKTNGSQNLASIGRWDLLEKLLLKRGFTVPDDAPSRAYVVEDAELSKFIQWKSQYKKGGSKKKYYVKNASTINKIENEKSLYNYASIVINGWTKAAKAIGGQVPSGVTVINWPHGRTIGWGSGSVKRDARGSVTLRIENKYANLNNIFDGSIQQAIWKRRTNIMESEIKKLFADLLNYWNSIKT